MDGYARELRRMSNVKVVVNRWDGYARELRRMSNVKVLMSTDGMDTLGSYRG